jgi:hypothetical protein
VFSGEAGRQFQDLIVEGANEPDELVEPTYRLDISFSHSTFFSITRRAMLSARFTSRFSGFFTVGFGCCGWRLVTMIGSCGAA